MVVQDQLTSSKSSCISNRDHYYFGRKAEPDISNFGFQQKTSHRDKLSRVETAQEVEESVLYKERSGLDSLFTIQISVTSMT